MAIDFAYEVYVLMDSYVSDGVGKQVQETFKRLQTSLTSQQLTQLVEGIITPLAKEAQAKYLKGEMSGYKQGQFEGQIRYCDGVNHAINKFVGELTKSNERSDEVIRSLAEMHQLNLDEVIQHDKKVHEEMTKRGVYKNE